MRRFVEGTDRGQSTLIPESLEDWIGEDNPVRVIDVFVDELDLSQLGFSGVDPEVTRPAFVSSVGSAEALHLRLPNPASSMRMRRTFGAPSGAAMGRGQSGFEPSSVRFATPSNGAVGMGS
jgi:hypothetical protein